MSMRLAWKRWHPARDILAELVRAGRLVDGQCFEIMDDSGELRAVVPFKEALKLD